VPGWHADTLDLQKTGAIQMLGIIQEQHPDRCALFMQWKQMDWPILVDSLNLYGIDVVPVTYAIDEHGIVRYINPTRDDFKTFVAARYDALSTPAAGEPDRPDLNRLRARATQEDSAPGWLVLGTALYLWGGERQLDAAIEVFERAARIEPDNGIAQFRLGTALRRRHESAARSARRLPPSGRALGASAGSQSQSVHLATAPSAVRPASR
jgi:hypothetical protein